MTIRTDPKPTDKPSGASGNAGDDLPQPPASAINIGVDVMSPYHLHSSNTPGQLHVSELLRDVNYGHWVSDMSISLYAKNKFGFVDGSCPMPAADSPELPLWRRCDVMVRGWLNTAMEKELRDSIRYARSAQEVWSDLRERFGKENAPRTYELRRALTVTRQDNMSVSSYYTKLRSLWDEVQSVTPLPHCGCDARKEFETQR